MEIFWTSVTLLSLCLFHSSLSETHNICKGFLPPVQHVALNSSVTVPCPLLSAPEMVFKFYKGSENICVISIININNTFSCNNNNSPWKDSPVCLSFKVNDTDNSTSFILDRVTLNTTALYTCEAERLFPPPFRKVEHTPQTIVFVEGRPVKQRVICQHVNHLVFWVSLGILAIYGLVMTCTVFILRFKLNQIDTPFKDRECRRKWQGVQHPTFQGFHKDTVV
ncbi:uncharacterized protein [Garra rufa]|uniref:uncharacterized protein n=1 Tax=Garra rufa TaxID=137080 RepID=UPI003CCEB4AD